jgi:PadR family transcriptional regulator AphA
MYGVTEPGPQVLEGWRAEPIDGIRTLRDLGILMLFFGAVPAKLADDQLQEHEARVRSYEELRAATAGADVPRGPSLALEAGLGHERECVRLWKAPLDEQAD